MRQMPVFRLFADGECVCTICFVGLDNGGQVAKDALRSIHLSG